MASSLRQFDFPTIQKTVKHGLKICDDNRGILAGVKAKAEELATTSMRGAYGTEMYSTMEENLAKMGKEIDKQEQYFQTLDKAGTTQQDLQQEQVAKASRISLSH